METRRGNYRWIVILPMLLLMYMFCYIDRTNISFAMGGMEKSFGITSTISGFISGIFFIGYTLLQAPGGHLASTISARRNILIFGILTGVFDIAQGFATNITMFIVFRFLLGVVEGVFLPTMFVLISRWFAEEERGIATNTFMTYQSFGPLIMSPICGFIVAFVHWGGFESWRWMLIIEGFFPIIWAFIFYVVVKDHPKEATSKHFGEEERNYLLESMEKEAQKPRITQEKSFWRAALNVNFILVVLSWFFVVVGNYGTSMWLPEIIKQISKSGYDKVGLIATLPWIATIFGAVLVGYINDKWGNKKWLLCLLGILAGVALYISSLFGNTSPWLSIIFLIIAMMASCSAAPTYLTTLPLFIAPALLGGLTGIASALANLGGFFGPLGVGALITANGGNKLAGILFLAVVYIVAGILMLFVNLRAEVKVSK